MGIFKKPKFGFPWTTMDVKNLNDLVDALLYKLTGNIDFLDMSTGFRNSYNQKVNNDDMTAAIDAKAGQITLSVSQTYSTITDMNALSATVEKNKKNLLKPEEWFAVSPVVAGTFPNFSPLTSGLNEIVNVSNPYGINANTWKCTDVAHSNAGIGYNTIAFTAEDNVTYRFSVWVKQSVDKGGTIYFGCNATGHTCNLDNTTNYNPYFFNGDLPVLGQWYLLVAYVHSKNYTLTTSSPQSGAYDINGTKVLSFTDFKMKTGGTLQAMRNYLYYVTTGTPEVYFYNPTIERVDGSELPLDAYFPIVQRMASAEQIITPTGITNKFTESLNGGTTVETGIVKYNKDGIEVSNSTANTKTRMQAGGFSVLNNNDESPIQQVKDTGIVGTILTVQDIKQSASAPFMIKVQNGLVNLYVDVTSGDDTRTAISWTQSVKTINMALSKVPKCLNGSQVNIYVKGSSDGYSVTQDVVIQGFTGSGNMVIYLDHGMVINGILRVLECTVPIMINGSAFAVTQGHTAWRRSGFYITSDTFCCLVDACNYFYALDVAFIQRSIGVGQGVMSHYGSNVYLESCEISNMWVALNASDMGRISYESLIGTNNTYGHYVYRGGLVQFPEGDSRATTPNNINGNMITIGSGGRTIGATPTATNGVIIPPSYTPPTYTPYQRTSEWGGTATYSWRDTTGYRDDNAYMYDGSWGYGNHRGFAIFDYTDIKNKLSGATINNVYVYLYRYEGSNGNNGVQTAYVYAHSNGYKNGYALGTQAGSIGLDKGQGAWVEVSTQLATDIVNGAVGFAIANGAYMMCMDPRIRIVYTK